MSNLPAITAHLTQYLQQTHPESPLGFDTDLFAAGILESLTIMDLLSFIERDFSVNLEPEEITPANFRTIQRLASLINRKQLHAPL